MITVRARINALTIGWPLLFIGLIIIVVGNRQRPVDMTGLEFIQDSSLSAWIRIGAVVTLVGFGLITIGYLRHDEDKI